MFSLSIHFFLCFIHFQQKAKKPKLKRLNILCDTLHFLFSSSILNNQKPKCEIDSTLCIYSIWQSLSTCQTRHYFLQKCRYNVQRGSNIDHKDGTVLSKMTPFQWISFIRLWSSLSMDKAYSTWLSIFFFFVASGLSKQ